MQSLMEQSALVIIDFEDAIKNGYARLSDEIATMYMEDTERMLHTLCCNGICRAGSAGKASSEYQK